MLTTTPTQSYTIEKYIEQPAATVQYEADSPSYHYAAWQDEYKDFVHEKCIEKNLDESIVLAVIHNESRFKPELTHLNRNGTTDYGLMQINEVNLQFLNNEHGIESMNELLDPYVNIECGTTLMAYHKEFTGNDSDALLRYQVGAGNYKRIKANDQCKPAVHERVLTFAKELQNLIVKENHHDC